jgi:hypothetical protein
MPYRLQTLLKQERFPQRIEEHTGTGMSVLRYCRGNNFERLIKVKKTQCTRSVLASLGLSAA